MRHFGNFLTAIGLVLSACLPAAAAGPMDGNRLSYLDEVNPYYPHTNFPKLITPQWVGEPGVEAVVVLAIDDMRDTERYEAYLRPILDRLKAIDGRAPVSIMTNQVKPDRPLFQKWLKEGLSIEIHTIGHPCPLLQKGDFAAARRAYEDCVDLMNTIEGNRPVAFRMPCCDSLNTPSPRFFAEIFNKTTKAGHFLSIDSSVFNVFTAADPSLPRELVRDPDGRERFRKYLPFTSFVNTIENYPYPYVIGKLCWEFPCIVPSDWEGQNIQKPNNPRTLEDMKAALDLVVLKQGVFNLVFHPHGWISNAQIVDLIDHAVKKHGQKVKFLNFREAQDRLNRNLLSGQPLRASNGQDNGVRILDLTDNGYMDVIIANEKHSETRLWDPETRTWKSDDFPVPVVTVGPDGERHEEPIKFVPTYHRLPVHAPGGIRTVEIMGLGQHEQELGGPGTIYRDLDGDGDSEIISSNPGKKVIEQVKAGENRLLRPLCFSLPEHALLVDEKGRDGGVRFVDLDEDGRLDVIFSDDHYHGIYLFDSMETGWSRKVTAGRAGEPGALPKIVRDGTDNGFWVHSRQLWWQNEDTARLPNLVDRRSFNDLLKNIPPRGKSPAASLRSIQVSTGFKVELMASEPLVKDPITIDWGADGKLWVVEMGDYPLGEDGHGKPGGLVRFLEDVNDDGVYDRQSTFLDGIPFPSGLMPWRNGVLVASAPDIFYAEDRDGDGRADHREVLFTGFGQGNQQHRLNGFELGLDGWVYGANGDSGGKIQSLKTGKKVSIQGRDFRFKPDTGDFEAESGQTQYGRHRDDWGHWFGNSNPTWGWQFMLAEADVRRNPHYPPPDPRKSLEPDTRLYPVSRTLARFNDPGAANHVTSANSPTPYRDDLFGPLFANSLFVSEPVHNLIHRMDLVPDRSTRRGVRPPSEAEREFLASSDNWFRPTQLKSGPDGALWIADMYRAVIEHPEWIPPDVQKVTDLRAGSQEGRIYRVTPVDRKPRPIPRLDRLDTAGLVTALDHPNGWQRDTAMRLLLHRNDPAAISTLRRLARTTKSPQARVQVVWTLSLLGGLDVETVLVGLRDGEPEVRRNSIQVSEPMLATSSRVADAALRLVDDPDARVRLQLALTLGNWADPRAAAALARLGRRDGDDPWLVAAVLSSATPHIGTMLVELFREGSAQAPPRAVLAPLVATAGAMQDRAAIRLVHRAIGTAAEKDGKFAPWQFAALAGLIEASARARQPIVLERETGLEKLLDAARVLTRDEQAGEPERLPAINLLGLSAANRPDDRDLLVGLVRPQVPIAVQRAAVAALGRGSDPKVPELLLRGWKTLSPTVRDAILDIVLSRPAWTGSLLSSLEDTCVTPAEIDPAHRRILLGSRDAEVRNRAEAVFAQTTLSRQKVIDSYRQALASRGDPAAGKAVFGKACATCHKLGDVGVEVGPNLASLAEKTPEALLIAILDPSRAFEARYTNFTVATTDGRILSGLVASETATSVTLRRQEGKDEVLLRTQIDEMASSGQSLMPEGLEKDLIPRDIDNLIAFLEGIGPPPKAFAGNHPRVVKPEGDGSLALSAADAEIFGDRLVFESHYANLGYWTAANDRAAWRIEVPASGKYAVWLEWACPNDSAGNVVEIAAGSRSIRHVVAGTGTWDDYQQARIGEIELPAGPTRLEVRSVSPLRNCLMDLRKVELRPVGITRKTTFLDAAPAACSCCSLP